MAVCISHQKIMSFFGSLKQIWLLSSTNLEFFRFTHTAYFVHLKNSRFVDSRSQILISFTEKTQDFFLFEMQTAIIAHQWKSKFSQCTANPAGLQRKTDRKMEKPIALRARSFFPWAKLLVLNFVERKNHFRWSVWVKLRWKKFDIEKKNIIKGSTVEPGFKRRTGCDQNFYEVKPGFFTL